MTINFMQLFHFRPERQRDPLPLPEPLAPIQLHVPEDDFEEEDEEDIDSMLLGIKDTEPTVEPEPILPDGFDLEETLNQLKYEEPVHELQEQTNKAVDLLFQQMDSVKRFCSEEFDNTTYMMTDLEINEQDPQPVKADKLAKFYKLCKEYTSTLEYRARIELMFFDIKREEDGSGPISQQIKSHVAFKLVGAVRQFLLAKTESLYMVHERHVQQRAVTTESYGKVRYVGGYCVSSLRQYYRRIRATNCYKSGVDDQNKYNNAVSKMSILEGFAVHEHILELHTAFPESLIETASRQNITRGLTNITDQLFTFFISLCKKCLSLLVDRNLNIYAKEFFNRIMDCIVDDSLLYEEFVKCIETITQKMTHDESGVMEDLIDSVCAAEQLYKEIVKKFLMVMMNQFMRDFLQSLAVEKKNGPSQTNPCCQEKVSRRSDS